MSELVWVVMPNREKMGDLLKEDKLIDGLNGSGPRNEVCSAFIEAVAGSEKDGMGLALAWFIAQEQVLLESEEGLVKQLASLGLPRLFNMVIDVLDLPQELTDDAKRLEEELSRAGDQEDLSFE